MPLPCGWINYYRYAHNLNVTGGRLSMVIYWHSVHYLAKRHRCSIARTMKDHYARDPKTGCLGLYVSTPAKPQTPEHRYFVWHKSPTRLSFAAPASYSVEDEQPYVDNGWAKGRSLHKRVETREKAKQACEHCGTTEGKLYVHHPNRLAKAKRVTKGMGHVAQSGEEQKTILLCHTCHTAYHANS